MVNSSINGNMFRLRKYQDGSVKDIIAITNPAAIPGITFGLGYTVDKVHKVVISSNGTILTIIMSVDNSKFFNIIEYRSLDIEEGLIGVGTCKCKAVFTEIKLRPPKLTLSEQDKKAIINGAGSGIVISKGKWEEQKEKAASNQEAIQGGEVNNEVEGKQFQSEASLGSNSQSQGSQTQTSALTSLKDAFNSTERKQEEIHSSIEIVNNLETDTISKDGSYFKAKEEGKASTERGWSDKGYSEESSSSSSFSSSSSSSSSFSKSNRSFTMGWEKCINIKTNEERHAYCNNIKSDPLRTSCNSDFCTSCCNSNISDSLGNLKHQCIKTCYQSTSSDKNADISGTCINSPTQSNAYTYCDSSMNGKDSGFITKCKLDMCNLCCATVDAMLDAPSSSKTEANCFNMCSIKFNTQKN